MKDKIISYIGAKGPSLPTAIGKELSENSFFISAHLSELKEQGKIKISNIKVGGGSPLYYLPGQEALLQNFSENLGDKEKKIYDLLKEKKVVRDSSLVPVFRAAIRSIKDFAYPFRVRYRGNSELFWKWYIVSNDEASNFVRKILGVKLEVAKKEDASGLEKAREENKEKTLRGKKENQQTLEKKEIKKEIKKKTEDKFYAELNEFFLQNKIKIIDERIVRKTEAEFIVEVPSPVGGLKYFVKAKSKKKVNDGDLSSVFIQGQTKRLPVLYLSKGELTKKAKEMPFGPPSPISRVK